jgi:hypothetical protein
MTQEQINKFSASMAEFMGFENDGTTFIVFGFVNNKISAYKDDLKFHTSYDWLMPIWVKFRDLHPTIDMNDDIAHETIKYSRYKTSITYKLLHSTIEEVFEELGKAIEWYNTIKK